MRKEIVMSLCLALALPAAGQVNIDCEPVIYQQLDSVVNYVREGQTDIYAPVDVFVYNQSDGLQVSSIERLSLPSRIPVNRQLYYYGNYGLKTSYILQVWNGSEYINSSKTDYQYGAEGYRERDVFSSYDEGLWVPYQLHLYNYDDEMTVLTYLRQMMYSPGVWTDFSYKNYIYDDQDRLIERNEQRISDDVIFWVELFTYDDQGRTDTRVRQTLKYFPETHAYDLVNLNRQTYSYDRYGELSSYLTEAWNDGEWVLSGKSVYYRSLLTSTIIQVCYKGKTILVPVRVFVRLFDKGALPGSCECLFPDGYPDGSNGHGGRQGDGGLLVYPNPASSEITIILPEGFSVHSDINIYNHSGTLVLRSIAADGSAKVNISVLRQGSYYLVVTGDNSSLMASFVKK